MVTTLKGPDIRVWSKGRGLQDVRFYQRADVPVLMHYI